MSMLQSVKDEPRMSPLGPELTPAYHFAENTIGKFCRLVTYLAFKDQLLVLIRGFRDFDVFFCRAKTLSIKSVEVMGLYKYRLPRLSRIIMLLSSFLVENAQYFDFCTIEVLKLE